MAERSTCLSASEHIHECCLSCSWRAHQGGENARLEDSAAIVQQLQHSRAIHLSRLGAYLLRICRIHSLQQSRRVRLVLACWLFWCILKASMWPDSSCRHELASEVSLLWYAECTRWVICLVQIWNPVLALEMSDVDSSGTLYSDRGKSAFCMTEQENGEHTAGMGT